MKLSVPLIKQPTKSNDCGIACLAMLLAYYKIPYSYKDLRRSVKPYSWGTVTPQLGLFLLENGFDVEIVTMHPALFNLSSTFKNEKALIQHFLKLKPSLKNSTDRIAINYFIKFVEAGGTVTPRIPNLSDIEKEISHKRPILSTLTHWFLTNTKLPPRFSIHFNIITGISRNKVMMNDPDWGHPFAGKHIFGAEEYMYAIYASAKGGIDDACLMKVKKK